MAATLPACFKMAVFSLLCVRAYPEDAHMGLCFRLTNPVHTKAACGALLALQHLRQGNTSVVELTSQQLATVRGVGQFTAQLMNTKGDPAVG